MKKIKIIKFFFSDIEIITQIVTKKNLTQWQAPMFLTDKQMREPSTIEGGEDTITNVTSISPVLTKNPLKSIKQPVAPNTIMGSYDPPQALIDEYLAFLDSNKATEEN